jgi:hypothetical protein
MKRFGRLALNESEIVIVVASEEETDRTYDEVMDTVDDLSTPDQFINLYSDRIKGGSADLKSPSDFDLKSLIKGAIVELEHTSDLNIAVEIAMDHLIEDPQYYDKLEEVHEEIKKVGSKWAVYPKKPKKGKKRRTALGTHSSREKALNQLRAIEISKAGR